MKLPFFKRAAVERDMAEEMEFHREARARDLERQGLSPAEAARQARLEFGSTEAYREECRAALGYRIWDELAADTRFALRGLRQHPGFHAAAVFILTLAIGVNTAFFTLYSNYFLRPMEVSGADRQYSLAAYDASGGRISGFNLAEIDALRQAAHGEMEGLFTAHGLTALVHSPVHRQSLVISVSADYFRLMGGTPRLGRTFTADEENQSVTVLSHHGAQRLFPDTPDPIGRTLRIQTVTLTVIGVMPATFTGNSPALPDLWIGAGMRGLVHRTEKVFRNNPAFERFDVTGVLAPGISRERTEAALSAVAARFERPGEKPVARVELKQQSSFLAAEGEGRVVALLLFGAFGIVLLVACANLANLFLARAASRTHEIAMRLSLGASRSRIIRQLLTESTITALLGAAGGCILARAAVQWGMTWAESIMGAHGVVLVPVATDWRVFLYAASLGAAAGVAFGLMPALELTAPNLTQSAKREASSFAGRVRPRRMRNLLISGQAAASVVLLLLGALLTRTIQRVAATDYGYDAARVFALRLDDPSPAILREIGQLPGVAAVAKAGSVPLWGDLPRASATAGGHTREIRYNSVSQGYFEVLGLRVEGRGFKAGEAESHARVAVISRATASKMWPGASPIGQTFTLKSGETTTPEQYEVVGVVPDVVSGFPTRGKDTSAVYLPAAENSPEQASAMARITGNIRETTEAIRQLCARSTGCDPMSSAEAAAFQTTPFRIAGTIAGILAGLALLLTGAGLYSVSSFSVIQRRREIGVHLALGARPAWVVRRMLGEALRCVGWGVAVALPLCLAFSRIAASNVTVIQTFDTASYLAVPLLLAVATAIACAVPARRAASVDPASALREE